MRRGGRAKLAHSGERQLIVGLRAILPLRSTEGGEMSPHARHGSCKAFFSTHCHLMHAGSEYASSVAHPRVGNNTDTIREHEKIS